MRFYLISLFIIVCHLNLTAQGAACREEAKLDLVQAEYGLTGNGVLTVMMDRGIDYTHPDFIDGQGNTRILYIYDLYDNSGANDADNPYGIGTIYDSAEINASLQSGGTPIVNDIFGHGTATTGIMSGNGYGLPFAGQYQGVAPEAKIISIIITRDYVPPFNGNPGQQGQYNPALLPTAFEFATDKITEAALPSVTLLNIGSIGDPTDGSIPICDLIEDYTAAGNTFVCGVGDDGGKDNHAIKEMELNQDTEFLIEKGEQGYLRFTGWYSEDDRVQLSIQRPNGVIEGPFDPPPGPNGAKDRQLNQISIYHRGANVEFSGSSSPLRQLLIDFYGETGSYKVILSPTSISSDGVINGMLNPARYNNGNGFLNNDNPGGNINAYSSCPYALSPGDYIATNSWTDINNVTRTKTGQGDVGDLWLGSSVGPTMDGRLGIDLVAPGEIAAAAYSHDSYYGSFFFNVLQNSNAYYGIQTAVSAAAPLTAGVVALMLEANPDLSPQEIKTILQETSRSDAFTGSTPNESWGYGKLDALAAVEKAMEMLTVHNLGPNANIRVQPNPFLSEIRITSEGYGLEKASCTLYSLFGEKLFVGKTQNDGKLKTDNLSSGVYFLVIDYAGHKVNVKVIKL